jgi:hypothetical protein
MQVPPAGGVRVYLLDTYIDRRIGKLQPTREIGIIRFAATTIGGARIAIGSLSVLPTTAAAAVAARFLDDGEE